MNKHFRLAILILLLLVAAGGLYAWNVIIKNGESQAQLANQKKCSEDGATYFAAYKNKTAAYNIDQALVQPYAEVSGTFDNNPFHIYAHELYRFDNPTYHFNGKLNTCLVAISYEGSRHATFADRQNLVSIFDDIYAEVDDIYSNKVLITTANSSSGQAYQQQLDALMSQ